MLSGIRCAVAAAVVIAINMPAGVSNAEEVIRIGYAGGFTGYLAPFDQPTLEGVRLAVDEINKAGGIDGKYKIELITRDMRSEIAQAAIMTQELLDEGVNVVLGPCDADPAITSGQITQAVGIPNIAPCSSAPTIPPIVGDYMFDHCTADNLQGTALAQYAVEQGYKRALILISRDTPYTDKLPQYFAKVFEAKGGELLDTLEFRMGQQDFSAEVTKIKQMNPAPDVIMTAAYEPDFPAFIKQLRSAGIVTPVLGSDGIDTPTTVELGSVVEGVVFSNAGFPTPGSPLEKFNELYKAHYGQAPATIYTALGYDVIHVIAAAVKASGDKLDGKSLRDALDQLQDVPVATGTITYKGMDRVPLRSVALNRITNGQKVYVKDILPDSSDVPPGE
jgi:branched-chain amino acid transport system substrate-binding protein